MTFIGKILGALIGFRLGGFFGMLAGVFLGHLADKKLYELGTVNSSFFKTKTTRQLLFMQTTFAVLGHLSKAKGRVTENDILLATNLMDQMQLDDAGRRLAQEAFNRGKQTDFPIRQVIREFRLGCGQRADLLRAFLSVQIQAAFSDDHLHDNEKDVLFIVAEELAYPAFNSSKCWQWKWRRVILRVAISINKVVTTNNILATKAAINSNLNLLPARP